MYTLIIKASFDAAHSLPNHPGQCKEMHGHTYKVTAEFSSDQLNELDMVMDFAELKDALKSILPDHKNLNDIMTIPSTAENIAKMLFDKLVEKNLPVTALTLWETDKYGCRYTP